MSRRIRLGESLVESGLITQAQLDEALRRRVTTGERIGEALVGLGFISERDLLKRNCAGTDYDLLAGGLCSEDGTMYLMDPGNGENIFCFNNRLLTSKPS